tara:strand:- start:235 stop:819 length:585 start_codon:yes stop_codon:yes gene_type:complete
VPTLKSKPERGRDEPQKIAKSRISTSFSGSQLFSMGGGVKHSKLVSFATVGFWSLIAIFTLAGCETTTTGIMQGVTEGEAVMFQYSQDIFENDGTLQVTMPSGERFTGKFVQASTTSTEDAYIYGDIFDEDDDDFGSVHSSETTMSSKSTAILIGNQGNSMECRFQFSSPEVGIDGGGVGHCETSFETRIDIIF